MKASWNGVLMKAQDRRCGICGRPFPPSNVGLLNTDHEPSIDHVWPKKRGGYEWRGNCVLAHRKCNNEKADRLPTGCEVIFLIATNERMGCATIFTKGVPPLQPYERASA